MLQPAKCKLFQKEVEYLRHLLTASGLKPLTNYLAAVKEWPMPQNIRQLRAFMGKVNYYKKFVPGFALHAAPLFELMKKKNHGTIPQ